MDVREAIYGRRSVRRFRQTPVPRALLEQFVDAARMAPSGSNLQPWEFVVVDEPEVVSAVFSNLMWAGHIAPAGDPPDGERPTACVAVLLNGNVRKEGGEHDAGAAIQNLLLSATAAGIGSCWVGSVNRRETARILGIPGNCRIDSVIALGYPAEAPVVEACGGSVKYWKDENGVLRVPKRRLAEVLHFNRYGEKGGKTAADGADKK